VFGTRLTAAMLGAAALGVFGVALLFVPELLQARHGGDVALGIVLGLGGTLIATGGNIVAVRNQRAGIPVMSGAAWGMAWGAAVAGAVALAQGASWTIDTRPAYLASLAYLAVFGSIVAFGAYLTLLGSVGPGPAAYVGIATPIVALLLSTLLEGYRWTLVAAIGVAIAVFANWLALKASRRATQAAALAR
jgi:drug/metabolite transporter (DMT)-like permease